MLRSFSVPLLMMAVCGVGTAQQSVAQCSSAITNTGVTASSIELTSACGSTSIQPWGESIVRVGRMPPDAKPLPPSLIVNASRAKVQFDLDQTRAGIITMLLPRLRLVISRTDGHIRFEQLDGTKLLEESEHASGFAPSPRGQALLQVQQRFKMPSGKRLYGLGQQQSGQFNLAGTHVHLQQANKQIALPMLLSSGGWGLLWDNASVGDVSLGAPHEEGLSFSSEAARASDYYFIAGANSDAVIRGYRQLTGAAPLLPRWAWGFWQSRERYQSQDELLEIARRYRAMQVPIDAVVQDWQYWPAGKWGSHRMDPARFPDPENMLKSLHAMNVHAIVSVWPRFDLGTDTLTALNEANALFPKTYKNVYPEGEGRWYDPYGEGRNVYWHAISERLGKLGFDGWWLDASEAELGGHWGEMRDVDTDAGPGALVYNAYPLMHTTGVYQGHRRDFPSKRPLILTRSAWAGQQRNSAISWSGDIDSDWETFRRQIPAGLNFVSSGIPYWNTDIGGFFGREPQDPDYRELFVRWFQYGAFTPMFRVHGTSAPKEIWRFDPEAQDILIRYNKLRYRLLPYIYSVSWDVTNNGSTMMRPLVMDYAQDIGALDIPDQFMFGPAIMVAPVTRPRATVRTVYLPQGNDWYDFWTGKRIDGGSTIAASAPIQSLPLFVRAGAILPMGPVVQHAEEQPNAPIELRVYRGADGQFIFYDDAGDGLGYELGERAIVEIKWNDATQALTFSKRNGRFPGMLPTRFFDVVIVNETDGGSDAPAKSSKRIRYTGSAQSIMLQIAQSAQ